MSPDSSLLREFHFSTTIQQTYKTMMGQVTPPVGWEARFSVNVDPLQRQRQRVLRLTIQIQNHQRRIHCIGGEDAMEEIRGFIASAEEPLDDYLIKEAIGASLRDRGFVTNAIKSLFFKIKQSLYEYDPRIGHCPSRDGPLLPCPLLDPDEPLSRMGVFVPILFQYVPSILEDDRVIGTHCPLCEDEIDDSQEFMWGGCNMLWVHLSCWRDA